MTDILKTRLEAIDADCESAAKIEVDELYDNAYHDGSKFHVPSPQAAEQIWLKLIARKEHEFVQEMARILKPGSPALSKEAASNIEGTVDDVFADNRYVERMQDFYREVSRKALLHEPSFEMEAKRLDLLDSTYRAGVSDALHKARRNIHAKLESYVQKQPGIAGETDFFSQWRQYSSLSPWRSIVTIVLLSLTSYLIAFIIASEAFQEFLERFGWSGGTGL
ncbi:hypothetical protein SAMN05216420_101236 [Nitrosospira sp. Nl5]|uniref:hypothetical protein n=1 Tax=Nitrosospira sp. Nl5 TaxID=200120 RepID=UPI0008903752|nr:hypothetical protein [Nitrosospira sp. Nl5]SCX89012.1 hypothetical protein SAMN05216420_101236 [Nitrosospira sp. Nl5]